MERKVEVQVQLLCDPSIQVWVVTYRLWSIALNKPLTEMAVVSPFFRNREEASAWRSEYFGDNFDRLDLYLSNN